jgi:lambda family phage portal protein
MGWLDFFKRKPAPAKRGRRLYAGAQNSRLMFKTSSTSADTELAGSLRALRDRSRALCRDVVYAKRAKQVVVNNVIGSGVGMQAQVSNNRKRLVTEINDAIETAWADWSRADNCHTGGVLHFCDLERAAMSEVFVAGEAFIRLHRRTFGDSRVPLGLELIEAERVADEYDVPQPLAAGNMVRLGVEVDSFGRPVAYWIKNYHPQELRTKISPTAQSIERVPAEDIIHLKLTDRWPQTRGEPMLHAAINRINQLGEFEEAAVVAARIGASKVGFFENPEGDIGIADGTEADGTPSMTVEAGEFTQLPPGYKFSSWDPNYPNDTFDPFTRAALRGIAAGVGVSYEALSRDYSQSNYSSSRLALLDDRDTWRALQQWWIRAFRQRLHREWLQAAVLAGQIPGIDVASYATNRARFEAVKFKPRGWSWVDPTKEVAAYKEAEKAGYITKTDIIAATGGGMDIEDVIATRRRELDMLDDAELTTDTTAPAPQETPAEPVDDEDEDTPPARVFAFKRDYE